MKLSDAAVLGDSLRTRSAAIFLEKAVDGTYCGCLIGGACLAAGANTFSFERMGELFPWLMDDSGLFHSAPNRYWPWREELGSRFFKVRAGTLTFEELIAFIKSVEPSCGDCNRFDCSCVKSEAVPVTEKVTA